MSQHTDASHPTAPAPWWLPTLGSLAILSALALAVVPGGSGGRAPAASRSVAAVASPAPSVGDTLAARFPRLAESLAVRSGFAQVTWERNGQAVGGVVTVPGDAPAGSTGLTHFFPHTYTDGLAVRAGGMTVWTLPQGAAAVPFADDGGRAVYRDAYPSTTVLHTAGAVRGEEFLHLADATAPTRFSYLLSTAGGDLAVARTTAGDLALSDGAGHRARIEAPWVVDAHGVFSAGAVRWQVDPPRDGATRVTLELDATGLAYPLVIDPTWAETGAMGTPRYGHTMTPLPNGKVLVTGGVPYLDTCELYDPASGTWSPTGSMLAGRRTHTAVLLATGKVLVLGGISNLAEDPYACELYDPASGTWSATASLAAYVSKPTATLLADGRVLVIGGSDAQLYHPSTGVWTVVAAATTSRQGHTATLLPSGKVLVAGGDGMSSCELFDPSDESWSPAASLPFPRGKHTATLLPASGKVLVSGGLSGDNLHPDVDLLLYDVGLDTWTISVWRSSEITGQTANLLPTGDVLFARGGNGVVEVYSQSAQTLTTVRNDVSTLSAASCVLPGGQVLLAGGYASANLANCYLYSDVSGATLDTHAALNNGNCGKTGNFLLPDGRVLVAGGTLYGSSNPTDVSVTYDRVADEWTATGSLARARYSAGAVLLASGEPLMVGGFGTESSLPVRLATCERYQATDGTWSAAGTLAHARAEHTATLLPDGTVLAAGGADDGWCERYDPTSGTWSDAGQLGEFLRTTHTATLLPSGKVLVVGGLTTATSGATAATTATCWLYDPSETTVSEAWKAAHDLGTARRGHSAVLLPSGKVLVVGGRNDSSTTCPAELYDPDSDTWTATATTMVQARSSASASVLLADGRALVVGGSVNQTSSFAEIFDPATGGWTQASSSQPLNEVITALLPSGEVMLAGPVFINHYVSNCWFFHPHQGLGSTWQPVVDAPTAALAPGVPLTVTGTGFIGAEGTSGLTSRSSAANLPLVQVRSAANDQVEWLPWDPLSSVSATSAATVGISGDLPPGPAWLRVFVNGVPSEAVAVTLKLTQTVTLPTIGDLTYGDTYPVLGATSTSGLAVTCSSSDAAIADVIGGTLYLYRAGTVTITASQAGNDVYAAATPVTEEITISAYPLTVTVPDVYAHISDGVPVLDVAGTHYTTSDPLVYGQVFSTVASGALAIATPPTLVTGDYAITLGSVAADGYALTLDGSPLLHVVPDNTPPEISVATLQTITMSAVGVALDWSYSDLDEQHFAQTVATSWAKRSGPGTVTMAGPFAAATFDRDGTYVLRLTVDDGVAPRTADLTVVVSLPGTTVVGNVGSTGANVSFGQRGITQASGIPGVAGTASRYANGGPYEATWTATLPAGFYDVGFWKVLPGASTAPLALSISANHTSRDVMLAPTATSPPGWISLGSCYSDGSDSVVVAARRVAGTARISAVRFIALPGELIDAPDGGYAESGSWATSAVGGQGLNGSATRWTRGAATATWTLGTGGTGRVLLNRLVNPNNDADWAAEIVSAGSPGTYGIDARAGVSGWADLGRHTLAAGDRIVLSHAGTKVLRADALRFAKDTIVDNGDLGYREEGSGWADSTLPNYGHSLRYSRERNAAVTWRASLAPGRYRVWRFRNIKADSPTDLKVTVAHDGGNDTQVDDLTGGTQGWSVIGTYNFTGGTGQVRMTPGSPKGKPMRADAVMFEPVGDATTVAATPVGGSG